MASEAEYVAIKSIVERTKSILDISIIVPLLLHVFLAMVMFIVWGVIGNLQLITNVTNFDKIKIPP